MTPHSIHRRTVLVLAAAACAPAAWAAAEDTLAEIKQRGALRVGVTQAPPWFSKDPKSGEWTSGVGVSLGKAMAADLGVKFEPVEVTWGTAIAALQGNRIDMMSMMDATPERAQAVDFPKTPLLYYSLAVLARDEASPAVSMEQVLTTLGRQRLELAEQRCLAGLRRKDAWGDLTPKDVFRPDANFAALDNVLNDEAGSEHVRVSVPLLVLQATNDQVVPKLLTDPMVAELCDLGAVLDYRTYTITALEGPAGSAAHRATVEVSIDDAQHWIADRFAGKAAPSSCAVRNSASR